MLWPWLVRIPRPRVLLAPLSARPPAGCPPPLATVPVGKCRPPGAGIWEKMGGRSSVLIGTPLFRSCAERPARILVPRRLASLVRRLAKFSGHFRSGPPQNIPIYVLVVVPLLKKG